MMSTSGLVVSKVGEKPDRFGLGPRRDPWIKSALRPRADIRGYWLHVLFGARNGLMHRSKNYSMTSSARSKSDDGTDRPIFLAVARLRMVWKRVACSIGRSAGLAPLRMRST
jgi:hypothetical protein